jgi:hypothetical protein
VTLRGMFTFLSFPFLKQCIIKGLIALKCMGMYIDVSPLAIHYMKANLETTYFLNPSKIDRGFIYGSR